jgi:hypothetical protein
MRTNKKEFNNKKKKVLLQKSIQEQLAKNEEDDKNIIHYINYNPSRNNTTNINDNTNDETKKDRKIKRINKFDLDNLEIYTNCNDCESIEDSKDSANELNKSKEYLETPKNKNKNKFNKNKNKKQKKNQATAQPGKFKSTAADFKVKYKTELCKYFEINGSCKYGDKCAYAHGKENLRSKVTNSTAYRTRKCIQFFEYGYCPYGSRCQFKHQLQSNIINNPYDRKMTYKKILDTISKLENVDNIKKLIGKPRLSIFKEIIDDKNIVQTESRLLDDIKALKKENNF